MITMSLFRIPGRQRLLGPFNHAWGPDLARTPIVHEGEGYILLHDSGVEAKDVDLAMATRGSDQPFTCLIEGLSADDAVQTFYRSYAEECQGQDDPAIRLDGRYPILQLPECSRLAHVAGLYECGPGLTECGGQGEVGNCILSGGEAVPELDCPLREFIKKAELAFQSTPEKFPEVHRLRVITPTNVAA